MLLKVLSLTKIIFPMFSIFRPFPILIFFVLLSACESNKSKKPKIAIAGLAIESSTFSPAKTEEAAFLAREGIEVFNSIYINFVNTTKTI